MMRNNVLIELQAPSGEWINVSDYRLDRDRISIRRGRASGDKTTPPAEANVTLKNPAGIFSLRNPLSPLKGMLKRNTPMRISLGVDSYGMVAHGKGWAECPDSAALSFAGDLDIRVDVQPEEGALWSTAGFDLASKFEFVVGALGWSFIVVAGQLRFIWWPSGTDPQTYFESSSVLLPADRQRRVLRATLDVDNGVGGHTVNFYTGPSLAGPWTSLGSAQTGTPVTSLFNSTSKVRIGSATQTGFYTHGHAEGVFYGAELRDGINGTVVASPDFTTQSLPSPGVTAGFTDAQGNSWQYGGDVNAARIWFGDVRERFFGETAAWPPKWNQRHRDKHVTITASGVLRRYLQGKAVVNTALRDFVLSDQTALLSYFPLDGGEGTQYSRNIANTNQYVYNFYREEFAGSPVFKYGVDMGVPWLGTGMELERTNTNYMRGDTVSWDSNVAFDFVWRADAMGALEITFYDYTDNLWILTLNDLADSGLGQVQFIDSATGPVAFTTFAVPEINDTDLHVGRFQLTNVGGDIRYDVYVDGTLRKTGTTGLSRTNVGTALYRINYNHANTGQGPINLAHLVMWANASAAAIPAAADVAAAALGYAGEAAGRRIERVCDDGGIPITFVGNPDETTLMGPQFAEARMAQIRDAEATDLGILYEPRTSNGLTYRTRSSMYNQDAAVVLDYSDRVISPPFEPVDDDEDTRNDITATRRNGGSYRITKTTGPLAATDPPIGIGQYDDEIELNVETDAQLDQVAAWHLNRGTIDAARYPSLVVNLAALAQMIGQAAADALIADIAAADIGDRISVLNLDDADILTDLELHMTGYTETISNRTWEWTASCGPYDLYQVAEFGQGRYDADGSVLTAAISSSATSLQVSKTGTSIWTRTLSMFPLDIDIGGERITITGITSATSPQTFTVGARAVNGVVASHAAGTPVKLWSTPRFAL